MSDSFVECESLKVALSILASDDLNHGVSIPKCWLYYALCLEGSSITSLIFIENLDIALPILIRCEMIWLAGSVYKKIDWPRSGSRTLFDHFQFASRSYNLAWSLAWNTHFANTIPNRVFARIIFWLSNFGISFWPKVFFMIPKIWKSKFGNFMEIPKFKFRHIFTVIAQYWCWGFMIFFANTK